MEGDEEMGGQSDEVFMFLADCQAFESFPLILFLSYFRSFVQRWCCRLWPAAFIVVALMEEMLL
jgi:hypothetical protein